MEIGVYFPARAEYPYLHSIGVTYAVRPVLTPATGPNDAGFVSDKVIERTDRSPFREVYGNDEVDDDPTRLAGAPLGSFVNISNGRWGLNAGVIPPTYRRGVLNSAGPFSLSDPLSRLRVAVTSWACRRAWGTAWTAVINAATDGGANMPHDLLVGQANAYHRHGIERLFLWRWDYNKVPIILLLTTLRLSGIISA